MYSVRSSFFCVLIVLNPSQMLRADMELHEAGKAAGCYITNANAAHSYRKVSHDVRRVQKKERHDTQSTTDTAETRRKQRSMCRQCGAKNVQKY